MAERFEHLGVLVADLDATRQRWAQVLGYTFSPVTRYQAQDWRDQTDPNPHLHDARLSFCFEGPPTIEMLEHTGEGTHATRHGEGGHHLALPPIADNVVRTRELAAMGVGIDGQATQSGRPILMFSERPGLNDIHVEWVEDGHEHPDLKDDGSEVNRLPDGRKTLFDLDQLEALRTNPSQAPVIDEFGVVVRDLTRAIGQWRSVVGYSFGAVQQEHEETFVLSELDRPRIRLIQAASAAEPEGVRELIFRRTPAIEARREQLRGLGLRVVSAAHDESGRLVDFATDAADFNGLRLRYLSA